MKLVKIFYSYLAVLGLKLQTVMENYNPVALGTFSYEFSVKIINRHTTENKVF